MKSSFSTLRRLPVYLHYLKRLPVEQTNISATSIAASLGFGDVQVRKDLGTVSGAGRPKTGYDKKELISTLENYLGYSHVKKAVLCGAGKLGEALICYEGFSDYGLDIIAAFDVRKDIQSVKKKPVYHPDFFKEFCEKEKVSIGIITVPAEQAQSVCELMCESGIKAIWNFAPIHLEVPDGVLVQEENMAASLALLSKQMEEAENII